MKTEIYFSVKTPLGVDVRTTVTYWEYLITIKHPIMKGKEEIVIIPNTLLLKSVITKTRKKVE